METKGKRKSVIVYILIGIVLIGIFLGITYIIGKNKQKNVDEITDIYNKEMTEEEKKEKEIMDARQNELIKKANEANEKFMKEAKVATLGQSKQKVDLNNTKNAEVKGDIKVNTSKNVSSVHKEDVFEFSNMKISTENDYSKVKVDIKNTSETKAEEKTFIFTFLDDNKQELVKSEVYIPEIEPGKAIDSNFTVGGDITMSNDYIVTVK